MLRLITFLIFLILSVWAGIQVVRHPGYLLLVYQPWMVQMPLWFAALSVVLVLVLFYVFIDSVDRIQFTWYRLKNWLRYRREHQLYSKTQQGLLLLIEGRAQKAERKLLAGVMQTGEPLINYLAAAKAAQEQAAFDRRDKYIHKAYEIAPEASLSIGLVQAELELQQDQLEHAAATLNHLRLSSPRHPEVLTLLEKVYVRLGDWKNLQGLLPALRKAKIVTSEQFEQFEKNLYCEILRTASIKTLADVHQIWDDMPRAMRKNPDVACAYVKQLMRFSDTKNSEAIIRKILKQHWQPELVSIYGTLPFTNLNRQLVIVGAWLQLYGQKPVLLLVLGTLCMRVQLWGKAKDYFEKCLSIGPYPEASLEYGKLLEQLDEKEAALAVYRDGLVQVRPSHSYTPI